MKVLFVFGTRPEIIKCYPVYQELKLKKHEVCLYYTNQNFDPTLSDLIFKEYPYDLLDYTRDQKKIDYVLVQGDTWSVLEGALIAGKLKVKLGHIEAGIRSYDQRMIEEHIRIMVDGYSDFHFVPTEIAKNNIRAELGVKSYLVGNTIYDLMKDEKRGKPKFITVTLHRPETVDVRETLKNTLDGITLVSSYYNLPIKFFVHPRTKDKLKTFGISPSFSAIDPVERSEFMECMKNSRLVITDSGGVQEEAAILKIPCVTARISTERPETIEARLNILGGNVVGSIFDASRLIVTEVERGNFSSKPLYGDGHAGKNIVNILENNL